MITKVAFNPLPAPFELISTIPQLSTDPSSPNAEDAWVLKQGQAAIPDGTPIGLLLALTYTGNQASAVSYQFSYRTQEGTTVRTTLT